MKERKISKKLGRRISAGFLSLAMTITTAMTGYAAPSKLPGDETPGISLEYASDNETVDNYGFNMLTKDSTDTKNAGNVWTDKSVFTSADDKDKDGKIEIDGQEYAIDDDFLVAFSALGSSQKVKTTEQLPLDVVMLLDISTSMTTHLAETKKEEDNTRIDRCDDMIKAANTLITDLMKGRDNRVGVVVYAGGANKLLDLGHYEPITYEGEIGEYIKCDYEHDTTVYKWWPQVSPNVVGGSTTANQPYHADSTYLQGALYLGMNMLSTNQSEDRSTRIPALIVFSDGGTNTVTATTVTSTKSYTYPSANASYEWYTAPPTGKLNTDPDNNYWPEEGGKPFYQGLSGDNAATEGKSAIPGRTLVNLMLAGRMKKQIENNYGREMIGYAVALGVNELRDTEKQQLYGTLDPKTYFVEDTEYKFIKEAYDIFQHYIKNEQATYSLRGDKWVNATRNVTWNFNHPADGYDVEKVEDLYYIDKYVEVEDSEKIAEAFTNIFREIDKKAFHPVTESADGGVGMITYTDHLGQYTNVTGIKDIRIFGTSYKVSQNGETFTVERTANDVINPSYNYVENGVVVNPVTFNPGDITIKITEDGDHNDLTITIPETALPVNVADVQLRNDQRVVSCTVTDEDVKPLRILYTVGLTCRDSEGNIDLSKVSEEYINKNTFDNKLHFYSNYYKDENGQKAARATATFTPDKTNRYFYLQEDNTAPYYISGKDSGKNTLVQDGNTKDNNVTAGQANIYRNMGNASYQFKKSPNATDTAEMAFKPSAGMKDGKVVITHSLGNNGRLAIPLTELFITKDVKTVANVTVPADKTFDFTLTLNDVPYTSVQAVKYEKVDDKWQVKKEEEEKAYTLDETKTADFQLADGEGILFKYLPVNQEYSVTEVTPDEDEYYFFDSVEDSDKKVDKENPTVTGRLKASNSQTPDTLNLVAFTNRFVPVVPVSAEVTKTMVDRPVFDQEFAFQLLRAPSNDQYKDLDGHPADPITEVYVRQYFHNDENGIVTLFEDAEYTVPGEYKYTVKEIHDYQIPGIVYDSTEYHIVVKVTQKESDDGGLEAEVSYKKVKDENGNQSEEEVSSIEFVNRYIDDEIPVTIPGIKYLDGLKLKEGMFQFEIVGVEAERATPSRAKKKVEWLEAPEGGFKAEEGFEAPVQTPKDENGNEIEDAPKIMLPTTKVHIGNLVVGETETAAKDPETKKETGSSSGESKGESTGSGSEGNGNANAGTGSMGGFFFGNLNDVLKQKETTAAETKAEEPTETKAAETKAEEPKETTAAETKAKEPKETTAAETKAEKSKETKAAETKAEKPTEEAKPTETQPAKTVETGKSPIIYANASTLNGSVKFDKPADAPEHSEPTVIVRGKTQKETTEETSEVETTEETRKAVTMPMPIPEPTSSTETSASIEESEGKSKEESSAAPETSASAEESKEESSAAPETSASAEESKEESSAAPESSAPAEESKEEESTAPKETSGTKPFTTPKTNVKIAEFTEDEDGNVDIDETVKLSLKEIPMPKVTKVSNDYSGAFQFGPIVFRHEGVYTYKITEVEGPEGSITYDDTIHKVVITIDRDPVTGKLSVGSIYIDGENKTEHPEVEFNNKYEKPELEIVKTQETDNKEDNPGIDGETREPLIVVDGNEITYHLYVTCTPSDAEKEKSRDALDVVVYDRLPISEEGDENLKYTLKEDSIRAEIGDYDEQGNFKRNSRKAYILSRYDKNEGLITWTLDRLKEGETLHVWFTIQVPDAKTAESTKWTNTGYTYSGILDPNDPDDPEPEKSNTVESYEGKPHLTIKKEQSKEGVARTTETFQVKDGDIVTYYLKITNDGTEKATDLVVTDEIPVSVPAGFDLEFVEGSITSTIMKEDGTEATAAGSGSYDAATRTITWNLDELASPKVIDTETGDVIAREGAKNVWELSFKTKAPSINKERVDWLNQAHLHYGNNPENPGDPENPDDPKNPPKDIPSNEVKIYEYPPRVVIEKFQQRNNGEMTKEDLRVYSGDTVTYYLQVTNNGESVAENVHVKDTVPYEPEKLIFVQANDGGVVTTDEEGRTHIDWSLGNLTVGESKTVSFVVTVPSGNNRRTWRNIGSTYYDNNPDNPSNDPQDPNYDPNYDPNHPYENIPSNEVVINKYPSGGSTPGGNPGGNPGGGPGGDPGPDTTPIGDNPTPLADLPDGAVPLSGMEQILDEDVPLAYLAPVTGDESPIGAIGAIALAALGLMGAFGFLGFRKKEDAE